MVNGKEHLKLVKLSLFVFYVGAQDFCLHFINAFFKRDYQGSNCIL